MVLERHFELLILDCTRWLLPAAMRARSDVCYDHHAIKRIGSLSEFKAALVRGEGGHAIDYVGQFSPRAVLMFDALRREKIKLIVVDSGSHPAHAATPRRISSVIRDLWCGGFRRRFNALAVRALLCVLPTQDPEIALVAGSFWKQTPRFRRAHVKVPAHAFDYEQFLRLKSEAPLTATPYAVYLDERITSHEDNKEMGLADPATDERFYPSLLTFLEKLEGRLGLRVVVAGYPGSNADELAQRLGDREVFVGRTAQLLRDAGLILAHASTAVSYGVISRRPVVFLTSQEICRSWYQASIELLRTHLGSNIVNIDGPETDWPSDWMTVNEHAYDLYFDTFIKDQDVSDHSLWKTLIAAVNKNANASEASLQRTSVR